MIPFSLKVFIYKLFQFLLKQSTKLLTFRTPELFSGAGSSLQLCDHVAQSGVKNLLIVTDGMLVKIGLLNAMQARLTEQGVSYVVYDGVLPNPTIEQIETGLALLKAKGCTAILAVAVVRPSTPPR